MFLQVKSVMQEKYEKAMVSLAEMEKRAVMAESVLEATLHYQSGQVKAHSSPGYVGISFVLCYYSSGLNII